MVKWAQTHNQNLAALADGGLAHTLHLREKCHPASCTVLLLAVCPPGAGLSSWNYSNKPIHLPVGARGPAATEPASHSSWLFPLFPVHPPCDSVWFVVSSRGL